MNTPDARRRELIGFLQSIQRPDQPVIEMNADVNLIESGLIDSLALLQIILYLEESFGIDFAGSGLDTQDLTSVNGILEVIERETG